MKLPIAALAACLAMPAHAQLNHGTAQDHARFAFAPGYEKVSAPVPRRNCHPRHRAEMILAGEQYREQAHESYLVGSGTVLTIWRSVQTDTWSVVQDSGEDVLCIVAKGRGWAEHISEQHGEGM